MNWWVYDLYQAGMGVEVASWIFWVLLSITLHELGHGITAAWEGDPTPEASGHMTWNPFIHLGPVSLAMLVLTGLAWGAMPVDQTRFRHRRWGDVLVAAAGPFVNLLIAVLAFTALLVWIKFVPSGPALSIGASFWFVAVPSNLALFLLNLLPLPPLDGSHVLAAFSTTARRLFLHPHASLIGLGIYILVIASPIGILMFDYGFGFTHRAADIVGSWINAPDLSQAMYAWRLGLDG